MSVEFGCAYFVSFALQGGNRILHWLSCTYFWCSFRFFYFCYFFFVFFRVFSKKPGIWILWNMRKIGFSPERGAKNAYYRIPALYGKKITNKQKTKKKRKKSAQKFSLQYVNLASICWTISRPWGGLERVCWTNANAYHHAIAFHGMACQKIILHLTVGAGSGGKRITKWQKIIFWAAGLRTTWETCKETKKTRVSYVNHRWEPTSKKKSESEYHKLAPWKKTLPQKMATMFLFELAEHLWLYSGDHVRSSGTREGKKTKVAQVASSARSMQSSTFFSYFGLECVRLWTMGNFSLDIWFGGRSQLAM